MNINKNIDSSRFFLRGGLWLTSGGRIVKPGKGESAGQDWNDYLLLDDKEIENGCDVEIFSKRLKKAIRKWKIWKSKIENDRNDVRSLIPKGVLSSRKKLRKLSSSININDDLIDNNLPEEKIVHKITKSTWSSTIKKIHNAVK